MSVVIGAECKSSAIPPTTPVGQVVYPMPVDRRVARVNAWLEDFSPDLKHLKWVLKWHCNRHPHDTSINGSNFESFKAAAGLIGKDLRRSVIRKCDLENLLRHLSMSAASPFDCEAAQAAYDQHQAEVASAADASSHAAAAPANAASAPAASSHVAAAPADAPLPQAAPTTAPNAAPTPAPGASAATASVDPPHGVTSLKAADLQAHVHAAALKLQSIPKEANPERLSWNPLVATAVGVLRDAGL